MISWIKSTLHFSVTKWLIPTLLFFHNFFIFSGPSLMDFGQVCLRSASSKDLMIVNNLNSFIHVVVEVRKVYSFFVWLSEYLKSSSKWFVVLVSLTLTRFFSIIHWGSLYLVNMMGPYNTIDKSNIKVITFVWIKDFRVSYA